MNNFKFEGCIDCAHVGHGVRTRECSGCHCGENFEPRLDELKLNGSYEEDDAEDY